MTFTENDFEYSIIELFCDHLGYSHKFGPDIARDYHTPSSKTRSSLPSRK